MSQRLRVSCIIGDSGIKNQFKKVLERAITPLIEGDPNSARILKKDLNLLFGKIGKRPRWNKPDLYIIDFHNWSPLAIIDLQEKNPEAKIVIICNINLRDHQLFGKMAKDRGLILVGNEYEALSWISGLIFLKHRKKEEMR